MTLNLSVDEVDFLTGEIIGRPKSATFKTIDFIGVDVVCNICENIFKYHPTPEKMGFEAPKILQQMLLKNRLGYKTKCGFYKKQSGQHNEEILVLHLQTQNYVALKSNVEKLIPLAILNLPLEKRMSVLLKLKGVYGSFYRQIFRALNNHIKNCAVEICEDTTAIEKVMRFGFGWKLNQIDWSND